MKEMHGGSSRDDRQKREQQRQEREMAKFAQMYPFALMAIFFYSLLPLFIVLVMGGWPGGRYSYRHSLLSS